MVLLKFSKDLYKFKELKQKAEEKTNVYIISSELYNNFLEIYYDEKNELSDNKATKQILNMMLKLYFLKDMIIMCGQKMKKNRLIKKNL